MTLKILHLHLDHPDAHPQGTKSYFGGQLVTGHVQLECVRAKQITGLTLHWTGTAKIFSGFSITGSSADRPTLASETYFDSKVAILEPPEGEDTYALPEGPLSIPFSFQLPQNCPTSFQEPYAEVKYAVELIVSRPKPKASHRILVPFTVNGIFDLNHFGGGAGTPPPAVYSGNGKKGAALDQHQQQDNSNKKKATTAAKLERKLSFLTRLIPASVAGGGGRSPPLGFSVQLLRDVLVPGEFVQFRIEMWNNTKYEVSDVSLSLFQETKYVTSGGLTKTGLRQKLCATDGPVVAPRSTEIWETNVDDSLYLQIPAVSSTNLGLGPSACKLVSLEYFLQLEMALDGSSSSSVKHGRVKAQIPIVVGNVPLEATFKEFVSIKRGAPAAKMAETGASANAKGDCNNNTKGGTPDAAKGVGLLLGYPELCDPSFEEAANAASFSAPPPPPIGRVKPFGGAGADPDSDTEDEEFLASLQKEALIDFEFIPRYAIYTSIYGLDLAELMGPPPAVSVGVGIGAPGFEEPPTDNAITRGD